MEVLELEVQLEVCDAQLLLLIFQHKGVDLLAELGVFGFQLRDLAEETEALSVGLLPLLALPAFLALLRSLRAQLAVS